jgi:hypothetical protein
LHYPEPEKTHVICKLEDKPEAKAVRGERYLGGFVGRRMEREGWVLKIEKVEDWARDVRILADGIRRFCDLLAG